MSLPKKIAFVDIETTGCRLLYDRIIEIGILRVEDNILKKTFQTLINPNCYISPDIVRITGINPADLEPAPTFRQIKDDLLEILEDCVLVAHNVRFDLGFIKAELKRYNHTFSPKHFCTVKLSRNLYPKYRHHNLDALIERFNFNCSNRHRAFDDAKILWDFYQIIQTQFSPEKLQLALNKTLKRPSLPINLTLKNLDSLPEKPGVYIFYGRGGMPLYIGKSINIKERVLSHFSADCTSSTEMKISQQVTSIETIITSGELGALFKEASLIKKLQPLYNRRLRHLRKLTILKLNTQNPYHTVSIEDLTKVEIHDLDKVLGIFKSKRQAKDFLIKLSKEHHLCEKLLAVDTTCKACFGYRLGRCKGACLGKENSRLFNARFSLAFTKTKLQSWPFNHPISIEEKDPDSGKIENHIFDNWCYLGCFKYNDETSFTSFEKDIFFDLDTYKILTSFLRQPKNYKKVKPFKLNQLKKYSSINDDPFDQINIPFNSRI